MSGEPVKNAPESELGRPNSAEAYKPSGMRRCDMNGNNKQIFIVISQTGTVLSRILKRITGAEYNHASLSLSSDLKKMYSFGRRHPYNPFWGGFVIESPHAGTFRRFSNTTAVILAVEITEEHWQHEHHKLLLQPHLSKPSHFQSYSGPIDSYPSECHQLRLKDHYWSPMKKYRES